MEKISNALEFPFRAAGLLLGVPCYLIAMMLGFAASLAREGWRKGFLS